MHSQRTNSSCDKGLGRLQAYDGESYELKSTLESTLKQYSDTEFFNFHQTGPLFDQNRRDE